MTTGNHDSPPPSERDPQPDDDAHSSDTRLRHWCCPNCGQIVFSAGEHPPPDYCAYCDDLTTWKRIESE